MIKKGILFYKQILKSKVENSIKKFEKKKSKSPLKHGLSSSLNNLRIEETKLSFENISDENITYDEECKFNRKNAPITIKKIPVNPIERDFEQSDNLTPTRTSPQTQKKKSKREGTSKKKKRNKFINSIVSENH